MGYAVPLDASDASRRRRLLEKCREQRWFDYESENPPGWTDPRTGVTYRCFTYSIRLADDTSFTLTEHEVLGAVVYAALEHDGVAEILYRDGM